MITKLVESCIGVLEENIISIEADFVIDFVVDVVGCDLCNMIILSCINSGFNEKWT